MLNLKRFFLVIFIIVTLYGCSLSPGVIGPDVYKENKKSTIDYERFRLVKITEDFIKSKDNKIFSKQKVTLKSAGKYEHHYKIGAYDVLSITVWDHPELTIPAGQYRSAEASGYSVQKNGSFFFPYVGYIKAAGRTTDDIRKEITEKLTGSVKDPQVGVTIAAYRSQHVNITGEIENPGRLAISDTPLTVLGAISQSGGLTKDADKGNIILSRNNRNYYIDFDELSRKSSLNSDFPLIHGDSLHVSDNLTNKVFVLGEVNAPGSVPYLYRGASLTEVIGAAKGFKETTVNPTGVFVIRKSKKTDGRAVIYHLDARSVEAMLLAEQFNLRNRDIVYVTAAKISRWNRVISQILPAASLFSSSVNTIDKI